MPEWSGTWRLQAALVDKGGDLDKTKAFYQSWITQFGTYPEMKVEGQKRLYLALKAANDPDADGLLKDIILQNRSEGFDLGIAAGADAINEKLKANDWDGARMAFESTIRDFGEDGGLTLYSKIVYPYVDGVPAKRQGRSRRPGDLIYRGPDDDRSDQPGGAEFHRSQKRGRGEEVGRALTAREQPETFAKVRGVKRAPSS